MLFTISWPFSLWTNINTSCIWCIQSSQHLDEIKHVYYDTANHRGTWLKSINRLHNFFHILGVYLISCTWTVKQVKNLILFYPLHGDLVRLWIKSCQWKGMFIYMQAHPIQASLISKCSNKRNKCDFTNNKIRNINWFPYTWHYMYPTWHM